MQSRGKGGKRLAAFVGIFVLASSSMGFATETKGTVIIQQGALYDSADFSGEILVKVPIGTEVSILERLEQSYRVFDLEAEIEGWITKAAVSEDQSAGQARKGMVTANILNVRSKPTTSSEILKKLPAGTAVTIVGQEADWYQIPLTGTLTGWVSGEYIKLVPNLPEAYLRQESAGLFSSPEAEAATKTLTPGSQIYLQDYKDGWYQVVLSDGATGWVKAADLIPAAELAADVNRSGMRSGVLDGIEAVASKYIGRPYQYGQSGPNRFDCSGFVSYIFKTYYQDFLTQKGIQLPRSSRDQATVGTPVAKENLQIGDLVFFNTTAARSSAITHVAIYIGQGRIIHAPSTGGYVRIDSLNDTYYRTRYIKAIRLQ